ncbi:MAG: right-handed parallel beta-helix repeat-containing protein, partial [Bacteroidetes bacterium]|nr:right-handed parallel beta-helix repeat-containing protein [Bacteroidota bacterium]
GTYYENINFRGKNIVVTSRFYENSGTQYILSTVINGSTPSHPDTASCVLIVSGESSSAVLQGFMLTGGKGTRWTDEHGAGIYREGGGILVALSSPTIRHNIIMGNEIFNAAAVSSTGGAGMRIGDGGATVEHNVIIRNRSMYGAGIVLNYCSGTVIRNNIIAENSVRSYVPGKPSYGGGGLWIGYPIPGDTAPNIIENNTIIGNTALDDPASSYLSGRGGAMVVHGNSKVIVRNNIIRENHASGPYGPVTALSPLVLAEYNTVNGGYPGTGNTDAAPVFADSAYLPAAASPTVDAGDPSATFNDPSSGGVALLPARGASRNDIGAYGGSGSAFFVPFGTPSLLMPKETIDFGNALTGDSLVRPLVFVNPGSRSLMVDSVQLPSAEFSAAVSAPFVIPPAGRYTTSVIWKPVVQRHAAETLFVYHSGLHAPDPYPVILRGNSIPVAVLVVDLAEHNFGSIDINTVKKDTVVFVKNTGTGADSVLVLLNTGGINPSDAVTVAPSLLHLPPGDSLPVTFTLFPNRIKRSITGIYAPRIVVQSTRSAAPVVVEKIMRFRLTGVLGVEQTTPVPGEFFLSQNYPNPFNPSTMITFTVDDAARQHAVVEVFDLLGRRTAVLYDGPADAGVQYRLRFDASSLAGGLYFCRLTSGTRTMVRTMHFIQ